MGCEGESGARLWRKKRGGSGEGKRVRKISLLCVPSVLNWYSTGRTTLFTS